MLCKIHDGYLLITLQCLALPSHVRVMPFAHTPGDLSGSGDKEKDRKRKRAALKKKQKKGSLKATDSDCIIVA